MPKNFSILTTDFIFLAKPSICKGGEPAFSFSEEELEESIQNSRWHAVLKFIQDKPHNDRVRETVNQSWGSETQPTIGDLNAKQVLIQAYSEDDIKKTITRDSFACWAHYTASSGPPIWQIKLNPQLSTDGCDFLGYGPTFALLRRWRAVAT